MRRLIVAILSIFGFGCSEQPTVINLQDVSAFDVENPSEIDVVRYIYTHLEEAVKPGVETAQLEALMEDLLKEANAEGYFKGYRGFPNYISASINKEVLLTLPSSRRLEEGDLLTIQTGIKFANRYGYIGWTFPVGRISESRQKLMLSAQQALDAGVSKIRSEVTVAEVSKAMDLVIRNAGYSPNADYVGYQIGEEATMLPSIPCAYSDSMTNAHLEDGMTLAIIVIVHEGKATCLVTQDGWSVETSDGSDSVLFSRLVKVGKNGGTVLCDLPTTDL